tara:strand:+ start:79 stop:282 length:204 start_codon:yes stop_codon:yes gene_type:complete
MFGLFKKSIKNYTKWKIVSMTESVGWVTITQSREDVDSGLKEFRYEKSWVNTTPRLLEEMYKRVMSL